MKTPRMSKARKRTVLGVIGAIGLIASLFSAPIAGTVQVISKAMETVVTSLPDLQDEVSKSGSASSDSD